jgi:hypothetical protein
LGELETELETANQGLDAQTAALAIIEAYADGGSTAPTVEDYTLAQVCGRYRRQSGGGQHPAKSTEHQYQHNPYLSVTLRRRLPRPTLKLAAFEANTPADPQVGFTVADYAAVGLTYRHQR